MEQQPRPKHTKTIIAAIILLVCIAAFAIIYFFGDEIRAGFAREERPTQQTTWHVPASEEQTPAQPATYPTAPEQSDQNPIIGEPIPGGGIIVVPASTAPPVTQPPAAVAPPSGPVTKTWNDNGLRFIGTSAQANEYGDLAGLVTIVGVDGSGIQKYYYQGQYHNHQKHDNSGTAYEWWIDSSNGLKIEFIGSFVNGKREGPGRMWCAANGWEEKGVYGNDRLI